MTKYQRRQNQIYANKKKGIKDITHLKIDNFTFENVESFNYLVFILNADNKVNIEIAEKITKGNKADYANSKLIKPKLLKNAKMKKYKMAIRPVVTYSSETWILTAKNENNLRIFERQILRKICGPVNIDNVWRIRNNMDIDNLIEGADIVRFIKVQRIKWLEAYPKNGPSMTNWEATRLETYGNQTSRKTKTTMTRRCNGRSK